MSFSVFRRLLLVFLLVSVVPAAFAAGNGIAQLRAFIEQTGAARGQFEQVVTASSGRRPQHASGHFSFQRPGKFRWVYETPYAQVLVSDGDRLWAWDPDLNQVTVRVLGDALGSTPAAILAGEGALEREFELSEAGVSDGMSWVLALPRQAESGFESMRIGLSQSRLLRMELRDHFGQMTRIDFTALSTEVQPDPSEFRFTPPPDADVIGD